MTDKRTLLKRPLLGDSRQEEDLEHGSARQEPNADIRAETRIQGGPCGNLEGMGCALSDGRRVRVSEKDKVVEEKNAARRKLVQAICLCAVFMAVEVVGGILSNSLAILTDAAHLLSDIAGFAISLFAIWMTGWQATPTHSFGYHRMEILGAFLSIQLIWMITGIIVYEAIIRLLYKSEEVNGKLMFLTAAFGVVVNIAMTVLLGHDHGHSHGHSHGHAHGHSHGHSHVHSHGHSHAHGGDGHSDTSNHTHSHTHSDATATHSLHDHDHASHGGTCRHHEHQSEGASSAGGNSEDHLHQQESSAHGHHQEHRMEPQGHCGSHDHPPLTSANHTHSGVATPSQQQQQRAADQNINLRGAYLHVLGDLIQSVGVMIAGAIVWWKPEWKIVDLLSTLLFSVLVLYTTVKMVQDVMSVLMEGTPREIDAEEVALRLKDLPDVSSVHDLHIWALTVGKTLLACHVTIGPEVDSSLVLERVLEFCKKEYNIEHVTCQIEVC